jgi:hypothetical protein
MSKNVFVSSKRSILRFIKLWLGLKETPYWFHQSLTLGRQIEDFKVAKPILNKLFDALEVEMAKQYDMAAVYIMGHQENGRVHFHVVFLVYGSPSETPEQLGVILRREVWKRWLSLNQGLNRTGNLLKIQTKLNGLWYLLTNHLTVGQTAKEKGKPNWFGLRNKRLIQANSNPITEKALKAEFNRFFPVIKATVTKKPKGVSYDRHRLAGLRDYVEAHGRYDWEDFKRMETDRKGKVSDADFISFLNGWTSSASDGNAL